MLAYLFVINGGELSASSCDFVLGLTVPPPIFVSYFVCLDRAPCFVVDIAFLFFVLMSYRSLRLLIALVFCFDCLVVTWLVPFQQ